MGNIEIMEIVPKFEYVREVSKSFMIAIFNDNENALDKYLQQHKTEMRWLNADERLFVIYKGERFFEILYTDTTPAGDILKELKTALYLDSNPQDIKLF